jgi:hypothetical protein
MSRVGRIVVGLEHRFRTQEPIREVLAVSVVQESLPLPRATRLATQEKTRRVLTSDFLLNPLLGCRQNAMIRSGLADRTVSIETRIMSSAALSVSMTRTRPVWVVGARTRSCGCASGWLAEWGLGLLRRLLIGVCVMW